MSRQPPETPTLMRIARDIFSHRRAIPPDRWPAEWQISAATFAALEAETREWARFHGRPMLSMEHDKQNIAVLGIPVVVE